MLYQHLDVNGYVYIDNNRYQFSASIIYDWESVLRCGINQDNVHLRNVESDLPERIVIRALRARGFEQLSRIFYNNIHVNQLCEMCGV